MQGPPTQVLRKSVTLGPTSVTDEINTANTPASVTDQMSNLAGSPCFWGYMLAPCALLLVLSVGEFLFSYLTLSSNASPVGKENVGFRALVVTGLRGMFAAHFERKGCEGFCAHSVS